MLEILIQSKNKEKDIALVENGNLIEYYKENSNIERNEGNIYVGIIKDVVEGMQAAFVDIGTDKNSFIHIKDMLPKIDETVRKYDNNTNIKDIAQKGKKILVQVKKDSNEKKGARVSTHINLPGKYIALMPNTDIITISQKIENKQEQQRLIDIVKQNLSNGNGAIIRTSAENKDEKTIIEDIKKIEKKWDKILKTNVNPDDNKPKLIYKAEDIIEKMLIDLTDKKINKIIVNNKEEYIRLEKIKKENTEYSNIEIEQSKNVFTKYDIQKQIEKIDDRKIWLKCGAFITIDKTEALTAIDVNTGKYTGKNDLEETVCKVNKEATIEIAKQLRLKDIGGIIIIDYIDMKKEEHKKDIENLIKQELKKDRAKTQVEGFTKLDLMELTRKHICSHRT